ncbi:MAG: hypothetical protein ACLR78_13455 [Roseburia sp.]
MSSQKEREREVRRGNPLALLKEYYDEFEIHKENDELNFSGGLVGNVGYDFIRYSEKLPEKNPDEIGIETIQLMLMKAFIVMDYVAETLTAVVLEEETEEGRKRAGVTAEELIRRAMHPERTEGGCDSRCEADTGHGSEEAEQPEGGKRDGVIRKSRIRLPLTARRWRRSDTISEKDISFRRCSPSDGRWRPDVTVFLSIRSFAS